jgi:hypothetical protein
LSIAYQTEGTQQSATQIVVLHIPQSSRQVPAEERQAILLDDAAISSECWSSAMLDSTQIDNIIVAAMARETMKAEVERRAK